MLGFHMDSLIDGKIIGDINGTAHDDVKLVTGVRGKALSFNSVDQWADYVFHS